MIDTHSHIYLEEFDNDREEVIERARKEGVIKILMPNIDSESIDSMMQAEAANPGYCFSMMGLHPTSVDAGFEKELETVFGWFEKRDFIGVGEVGIDLYWDKTFVEQQMVAFEEQVKLAKSKGLPVVIHSRDSFSEVFSVIDKLWDEDLKGVFHSFTGTEKELEHILEYKTFFVGLNGVFTFKNSNIRDFIQKAPLDRIILETDAPYLTPVPFRGKRNEPAYVRYVCAHLALVYGVEESEADAVTTANAERLFFNL
jgi:TatD DNase family protein